MAYDSMAIAVDWLDKYRAKSLDVVDMYRADAELWCACSSSKIVGQAALEEYWRDRLVEEPAVELVDIESRGEDVVMVRYRTPTDVIEALLGFDDATGKIAWQRCGPEAGCGAVIGDQDAA
jgi:hypothetical protein